MIAFKYKQGVAKVQFYRRADRYTDSCHMV